MVYEKIFDALELASFGLHKLAAANQLRHEIHALQNECGSCSKFMTKQCPFEAKMKRRIIDPKCGEFELSISASRAIESRQKDLSRL